MMRKFENGAPSEVEVAAEAPARRFRAVARGR
jgi:hypothetical protein